MFSPIRFPFLEKKQIVLALFQNYSRKSFPSILLQRIIKLRLIFTIELLILGPSFFDVAALAHIPLFRFRLVL